MIIFARLPLSLSSCSAKEELEQGLLKWSPHFNTMNHTGSWTGITLRTVAGLEESIIPGLTTDDVYTDHANLSLFPSISTFLKSLDCSVGSVRLLNLAAGANIKPHRDQELCFEQGEMRLHVPLLTNPGVVFRVHEQRVTMKEGECWYINANLKHEVSNTGTTDRIHMVIDCKVNDWLKGLVETATTISHAPNYNLKELEGMVQSLREQNNPASDKLADELQQQYKHYFPEK